MKRGTVAYVELRQLEITMTVAEELHFGRAAALLHMSQPALTQAVARFEKELGTRLFDRTSRSVTTTAACRALLPRARALLADAAAAKELVQRTGRGELGVVRLGVVGSAMVDLLPGLMRQVRAGYPGLRVDVTEAVGADQLRQLRDGRLDLGLIHVGADASLVALQAHQLRQERLSVALPADHRLAHRAGVRLAELSGQPLVAIRREQEADTQRLYLAACAHAGFLPNEVVEVSSLQGLLGLVAAGCGWAFVTESVARGMQREQVAFLPLRRVGARLSTSVVWDPQRLARPAALVRDMLIAGATGSSAMARATI